MDKDIAPYLKYYIGFEAFHSWFPPDHEQYDNCWHLTGIDITSAKPFKLENEVDFTWTDSIKILLRKLESMTKEEGAEFVNIGVFDRSRKYRENTEYAVHFFDHSSYGAIEFNSLHPQHFHYLLSRGFDLWNLIDAGLAIDKETLNQNS